MSVFIYCNSFLLHMLTWHLVAIWWSFIFNKLLVCDLPWAF